MNKFFLSEREEKAEQMIFLNVYYLRFGCLTRCTMYNVQQKITAWCVFGCEQQ